MPGALEGLLVISVEQAVAAPYCAARLADAGARVRHRPADERHPGGHRRARLPGHRVDGADREGRILRQPLVVERHAVRGALLREGAGRDEERGADQG